MNANFLNRMSQMNCSQNSIEQQRMRSINRNTEKKETLITLEKDRVIMENINVRIEKTSRTVVLFNSNVAPVSGSPLLPSFVYRMSIDLSHTNRVHL